MGFNLTDANKNFDVNLVNSHKPNPVTDIHTRSDGDGTYSIIISNLPCNFEDEFSGDWTLQEARNIMAKMSQGNKTYREMCRVVAQSRKPQNEHE